MKSSSVETLASPRVGLISILTKTEIMYNMVLANHRNTKVFKIVFRVFLTRDEELITLTKYYSVVIFLSVMLCVHKVEDFFGAQ